MTESTQSLSVFSSGGVGVLWSPRRLFYWPLGGRGTEHLCWIQGTTWSAVYLWMIFNSLNEHHESQISVSDSRTTSLVHLFLPRPVASLYPQEQSVLLLPVNNLEPIPYFALATDSYSNNLNEGYYLKAFEKTCAFSVGRPPSCQTWFSYEVVPRLCQ